MCKCCMLGFLCSGFRTFQQTQHCRWLLRGCPPGCRIHLLSFKNTIYEALWWDWIGWDGICIYRWSSNKECYLWVELTLNTTCAICWPGDTFFTWSGRVGGLENHLIKSCTDGCEPERTLHRWGGRGQHRQTARSWQHRLAPQSKPLDTPRDPEPKYYGISRRICFCRSTLTTMSKTPEMSQVRFPCRQEGNVSPGNWACDFKVNIMQICSFKVNVRQISEVNRKESKMKRDEEMEHLKGIWWNGGKFFKKKSACANWKMRKRKGDIFPISVPDWQQLTWCMFSSYLDLLSVWLTKFKAVQ